MRERHRPFGQSKLRVPPILFGTAAIANVPHVIPEQRKLEICGEWFRRVEAPVFLDVTYHHGDGAVLDALRRLLQRIGVAADEVVISLTLDWDPAQNADTTFHADAIRQKWEKSCRLLGKSLQPRLVSICNVDQHLGTPDSSADRERRLQEVVTASRALAELKTAGVLDGLGITSADWRVARELRESLSADWVKLLGCWTLMRHPPEVLEFMDGLASRQIPVILAGVFNGGFLTGSNCLDGRIINAEDSAIQSLFAWRKAFAALCHGHGLTPAHACIQFALSAPGVIAVELNSSHPDRVAANVESVTRKVPDAFWASMKEEGLLAAAVP